MLDYFRRQFNYDAWANRAVLKACEDASVLLPETARNRLAHIVAAHRLWQARLRGEHAPVPVWPLWTLSETAAQADAAAAEWSTFLDEHLPEQLAETIQYTNSKGETHESRVEDVLAHVLLHAAYHRGQIASDLRAAGAEPPFTDFIHATRTGQV